MMAILSLLALLLSGVVPATSVSLTSHPEVATEGDLFTLSCSQQSGLLEANWFINDNWIFVSNPAFENQVLLSTGASNRVSDKFNEISVRINVSLSANTHNVTVRIKSELDDGSIWRCQTGGVTSMMITIIVAKHGIAITSSSTGVPEIFSSTKGSNVVATDTTSESAGTSAILVSGEQKSTTVPVPSADDPIANKLTIIIAGSVGGIAVIFTVVIIVIFCTRRQKRYKKSTKENAQNEKRCNVGSREGEKDESEFTENVLYAGYSDGNYSTVGEQQFMKDNESNVPSQTGVTDVYAQVQKKKKTTTDVQVTVNVENLYAKPIKKKREEPAVIHVHNTVNINIGNTTEEDA